MVGHLSLFNWIVGISTNLFPSSFLKFLSIKTAPEVFHYFIDLPDHKHLFINKMIHFFSLFQFTEYAVGHALWLYVPPVIILAGTVGNALSVLVFIQKKMRVKSTSVFLIGLAVVDTVVLYTGLLRWWIRKLTRIDIRQLVDCRIHILLTYAFVQLSAWILVLVTIERVISVFFPLKSREIITRRRAGILLAVTVVSLIGLNAHFMWTRVLYTHTSEVTYCIPAEEHTEFSNKTWAWIDSFVASYIPFAIMLISNLAIIYKVLRATLHRRSTMNVGKDVSSKMGSMTAMLLLLNFIFLLTTSPIVIFIKYRKDFLGDRSPQSFARANLAWIIVNLIQYCNNALNFFLYCISGARFRRELTSTVCRCGRKRGIERTMSFGMSRTDLSVISKSVTELSNGPPSSDN